MGRGPLAALLVALARSTPYEVYNEKRGVVDEALRRVRVDGWECREHIRASSYSSQYCFTVLSLHVLAAADTTVLS